MFKNIECAKGIVLSRYKYHIMKTIHLFIMQIMSGPNKKQQLKLRRTKKIQ